MSNYDEMVEQARKLGAEHGKAGGSWMFGSSRSGAFGRRCIQMDEGTLDGDWWDSYGPATAPLSGEWADGMTPQGLIEEVGAGWDIDDPDAEIVLSALCDAYEDAYYDAWHDEVLRMARYQVGES
jgi:hypothetical protein